MDTQLFTSAEELIVEAEEAIEKGLFRDAYELCLQATQAAPQNMEAWLLRAGLAASLDEKVLCVNRMNELGADLHDTHNVAFFALKEIIERDPFLAYMEETDGLYRVHNAERTILSIPKRRTVTTPYPTHEPDRLRNVHRWLMLAVFGLMLAGIGTLIFAPLAAWAALDARRSMPDRSGQVDSMVMLVIAGVLFVIGIFFAMLFIMHLAG